MLDKHYGLIRIQRQKFDGHNYMEIASEFKETISLKMSLPKGKKGAKLVLVKHNNGQVTKMAAEWDTNSRMPI